MEFEWDEVKRRINIQKHGIDFRSVVEAFDSPMVYALDPRLGYGEDRWIGIGLARGRLLTIVYTERKSDSIRIISARKANRYEKEKYRAQVPN